MNSFCHFRQPKLATWRENFRFCRFYGVMCASSLQALSFFGIIKACFKSPTEVVVFPE